MTLRRSCVAGLLLAGLFSAAAVAHGGQGPGKPATPKTARPVAPASGQGVRGTVNQLMRGILFPNSNVIFAAQGDDPAAVAQDKDPSLATDPLKGLYGGWQAVENSGLALVDAANLLMLPGRVCSNGKPAPSGNADWARFVEGLRTAGMDAYKAARARSQDAVLDASDTVTTACASCHDVYREKTEAQGGAAARCTK